MHPTICRRKLLALTVAAAACSAFVPSQSYGQAAAPAEAPATTTTSQLAERLGNRRLIWDRTRADVNHSQLNVARRAVSSDLPGTAPANWEVGRQWIDYSDFAVAPGAPAGAEQAPLVKAAYLGVASSPASAVLRRQLQLAAGVGLVIEFVEPDSPAHGAGVLPYDVLVRLNEQVIVNPEQLAVLVRTFEPNDEVRLSLIREGEPVEIPVRLTERAMKPLALADFETDDAMGMLPPPASPHPMIDSDLDLGATVELPAIVQPGQNAPVVQPALRPGLKVAPLPPVAEPRPGLWYADRGREIQADDFLLVKLRDVEGPGVATVKRQIVGEQGTLQFPRLEKPVTVVGCTPVQLERTVRGLYRSLGVEQGGMVDVFVCAPGEPVGVAQPPKEQPKPVAPKPATVKP